MSPQEQYNLALTNRFRVIHGAQDDFEAEFSVELVLLTCAILYCTEDRSRERVLKGLGNHYQFTLILHGTPSERVRELLHGFLKEIASHTQHVQQAAQPA